MLRAIEKVPGNATRDGWMGKSGSDTYKLALTVLTVTHRLEVRYAMPMSCAALVVS